MIESMMKAEKECTSERDMAPLKQLRPIGATFEEWMECRFSTELPHWAVWEIIGYIKEYKGRQGDVLLYERFEEIRLN